MLRRRLHDRRGARRAGDLDRRQAAAAQPQPQRELHLHAAATTSTPLIELVFECRLDRPTRSPGRTASTRPSSSTSRPGSTPSRSARSTCGAGLADSTPAQLHVDVRAAAGGRRAGGHHRPRAAGRDVAARRDLHVPRQRAGRHLRVQGRRVRPYEPCGFESGRRTCTQGGFEWGLEETEVGPHTFYVRAIDFEGNVGEPATYTWRLLGDRHASSCPGRSPSDGLHAARDAVRPGDRRRDAEHDRDDRLRGERRRRHLRVLARPRAVRAVHRRRSRTPDLLAGRPHAARLRDRLERGRSELEAAEYEWEVLEPLDNEPPRDLIERAPANNSSSTIFEFTGTDDLTPPELLIFECRLDSTNELDWEECVSPFNLLDLYTYQDPQLRARPAHLRGARDRHGRAGSRTRTNPLEGNVDPTPATLHVDDGGGHDAARHGHPRPGRRTAQTRRPDADIRFEFFGTDNATPVARARRTSAQLDSSALVGAVRARRTTLGGLLPGVHTFRVRAIDLA